MGDRRAVECAGRNTDHEIRCDLRFEQGEELAGLHRTE